MELFMELLKKALSPVNRTSVDDLINSDLLLLQALKEAQLKVAYKKREFLLDDTACKGRLSKTLEDGINRNATDVKKLDLHIANMNK